MPSTLSLISNMFALGMAAGPVVGGAVISAFWWGAAFLLAVPIAVVVLAGARRLLPEYADPHAGPTRGRRFSWRSDWPRARCSCAVSAA